MMHIFPDLVNIKKAVRNLPPFKKFHMTDPYLIGDRTFTPASLESFRELTKPSGVKGRPHPRLGGEGEEASPGPGGESGGVDPDGPKGKVKLKPVTPCF